MKLPKVILQVSASLDGRIALMPKTTLYSPVPEDLKPFDILGKEWLFLCEEVRKLHEPDFLLDGSNMLVSEKDVLKPLPVYAGDRDTLHTDYLPAHIINRSGRTKWISLVDGKGRYRDAYKAYTHDPSSYIMHLTSHAAPDDYLAFLREEEIPYIISGEQSVDLKESFSKLHSLLGVKCILTTSGGRLAGALLRENLLDEVNILFNPFLFGGTETPYLFKTSDIDPPYAMPAGLKFVESRLFESGAMWVRYKVLQ